MRPEGYGVYFDGVTSLRRDVRVRLAADALRILAADGRAIAEWPLDELHEVAGFFAGLRLTRDGADGLARLDVRDADLAAEIRRASSALNGVRRHSIERRVLLWSLVALVSFCALAFYGAPLLADRLAPMLPWGVDRRMGSALDANFRLLLPVRAGGFECGSAAAEQAGRAALDRLQRRLSEGAALPGPIRVVAVRSDLVNALALPGGVVYLFDGLIKRAENADELAGVLAHEVGHVAARDGARRAIQAGGSAFLFGFVLGDFVGGGAAVAAMRALSEASYSRAAESAADLYSVRLMARLGWDQRALGRMLERLGGDDRPDARSPFDYLASHPATSERGRAIDAAATAGASTPALDSASFADLKRICGDSA